MKTEDLARLGIEDESVQKELFKLHGQSIEGLKEQNESLSAQLESMTGNLTEAQDTIESMASRELNFEELKTTADEYKSKYEESEKAREAEVQKLRFEHTLDDSLKEAEARNLKSVKALLDMDGLEMGEDGKITGLDEQLEAIKSENDFLFGSEKPPEPEETPRIVAGSVKRRILGDPVVQAAKEGAGLK